MSRPALDRLLRRLAPSEREPMAWWLDAAERRLASAPPEVLAALAAWEVQVHAAQELACRLREDDVACAFLKGVDLNLRCYPAPGLRRMVDVDVLVAPTHLDTARARLEELGYRRRPLPGDPPVDRAFELCFHRESDGVLVDLHTHVDWPEGLGVTAEALLGRRVRAVGAIDVLDPLDVLLHLAVHLVKDVSDAGALALVDAVLALDAFRPSWEPLVERAREWRSRPALRMLLGRVKRFGGYDVPRPVLRELAVGFLPRLTSWWGSRHLDAPPLLRWSWAERGFRLRMVERWGDRRRLARRYLALRWSGLGFSR